jgi:hypothetical protein
MELDAARIEVMASMLAIEALDLTEAQSAELLIRSGFRPREVLEALDMQVIPLAREMRGRLADAPLSERIEVRPQLVL